LVLPLVTSSYEAISVVRDRQKPARSGQSDPPFFDIALLYWSKAPSHIAHQPKKARIIVAFTAMAHVRLPTTIISC
jgi:hypothetical protein